MKNVLVIKSSLQGENGNSNKAADQYINALKANTDVNFDILDLNETDVPHLSSDEMQAWMTDPSEHTAEQAKLASLSSSFIERLFAADEIVLAVPMYNFGIPSNLKAYFDRIARAGITFKYTENGPEGQVTGKTATILAARGGKYEGTPLDTQSSYIKNFLGFIGVKDTKFFYIEGLAMGEESANAAWSKFSGELNELFA